MNKIDDRRDFLKAMSGASLLTAASYNKILGANDRVRVGFIGIGLIGKRHLLDFLAMPDAEAVAICETYDPRLREGIETVAQAGGKAEGFKDFRKMYDRKDIDAICVATPDHWHALHTMLACAAGKDVYVEKPLTLFAAEGKWMTDVANHNKRVVQIGTQQRSGEQYQKALELIRSGHIGAVRSIRTASWRNIMPGFSQPVGTEALSKEDWNMWLGPAPFVPFSLERCIYHFRWFWDYSGGQTTNLLAHSLDIAEWVMNAAPKAVSAFGGRYSLKGIGETPDTFEAAFDYPGFVVTWSNRENCAGETPGLEFCGTKGVLRVSRASIEVLPDRDLSPNDQIPRFTAPPPRTGEIKYRTTAYKKDGYEQVRDQFRPHVRNFLDCVKSRKTPISDLETGHRTSTSCHLANLAMKLGRTLRWDEKKQQIMGDAEANQLLTRPYRAPWDKELKAVLPTKK